jgi:hypothetical protein
VPQSRGPHRTLTDARLRPAPTSHAQVSAGRLKMWTAALVVVAITLTVLTAVLWFYPGEQSVLETPAGRQNAEVARGAGAFPSDWPPSPEVVASAIPSVPASASPTASALAATQRPAPKATPPPKVPPPPRFSAIAGEGCPPTANSGYWNRGWFRDWYAVGRGGWNGDGCTGRMIAVPMSGDANRDDPDNVVVWWFTVPSQATCGVSVYVPGTGNVLDAAGAPATYFVYGTTAGRGSSIGQFGVDQVHNQGRWVDTGQYPVSTGQLSVRMVTRGVDWGPGRSGAHLGVSAVRVTC